MSILPLPVFQVVNLPIVFTSAYVNLVSPFSYSVGAAVASLHSLPFLRVHAY